MTDAEFRDAYPRHKDVLYRFARRMTGSARDAEDIVQGSFLALWRNDARFDPRRGAVRRLLIGVSRNLFRQRLSTDRPYDELAEDSGLCGPIDLAGLERAEMVARA